MSDEGAPNYCGIYADAMTEVVHAANAQEAWTRLSGRRGPTRLVEVWPYLPNARLVQAAPSN
jgi:hypothetical protein